MAVNVSKIAVMVTGETSQLTTAMSSASQSVRMFSGVQAESAITARNAQFGMQQLTFAAEDAILAFGTGGWAGALRGAANNLTMLAASLGGVKAMMLAVGAIAAVQLTRALMNVKDAASVAADEMKRMSENADLFKTAQGRRFELKGLQEQGEKFAKLFSSEQLETALKSIDDEAAQAAKGIEKLEEEWANLVQQSMNFQRDNPMEAPWWQPFNKSRSEEEQKVLDAYNARLEAIRAEQRHLQGVTEELEKQRAKLKDQAQAIAEATAAQEAARAAAEIQNIEGENFQEQRDLEKAAIDGLDELEKRLQSVLNPKEAKVNEILDDVRSQAQAVQDALAAGVIDQIEAEAMLKRIQDAAGQEIAGLTQADMSGFGKLATANRFGSSGAVSAINQAIAGSRNVSDQNRLLNASERNARASERVREILEETKGNIVHVVPVP